jgi:nitrite reductase (NADH) small subunit
MVPSTELRRNTYNLGALSGIPEGKGRTFCVQGHQVAVFRDQRQEVFATQAWCPHLLGPLVEGVLADGRIVCPLHGYEFNLRTGCAEGHVCGPLRTYAVDVSAQGEILLTVPEPTVR